MSTPPMTSPPFSAANATISPPLPASSSGVALSQPGVAPASPSGMSKGTLTVLAVAIVLGGLLVLVAVGVFIFFYMRNKKTKKRDDQSVLPKYDSFAGQDKRDQQNGSTPMNNVVHQQSNPEPLPETPRSQQQSLQVSVAPITPSIGSSLISEKFHPPELPGLSVSFPNSTFTYEELALATDNFSSINLLGQGGFGYVHKGVLRNGKEIAVKQLKSGSSQGDREFQAEVNTISRVDHQHLVLLVGYCVSGDQRMLIYEYIPNKTLEFHLHGERRPPMSWATRLKIAVGAAKGLAYLHEDCQPKIIHRDIKGANILLDNNFEAKVADFGLAKFFPDTDTHVSTRVMGSFGYCAPEYAASGKLTEKSDVFSFGIVLLELITGRRPVDNARPFTDDSMVEWARPLLMEVLEGGSFNDLVDPRLQDYDTTQMIQMVACAAVCVRSFARQRPRMSQVVRALEGSLSAEDLFKEIAPDNRTFHGSSDYDLSNQYIENLKMFRKLALEREDQSSGEDSVFTVEHEVLPSTSTTENQHETMEIDTEISTTSKSDVFQIPVE